MLRAIKKDPHQIGESPLLATRFRVANYSSKGIYILDTPFLPFFGKTHLLIFEQNPLFSCPAV